MHSWLRMFIWPPTRSLESSVDEVIFFRKRNEKFLISYSFSSCPSCATSFSFFFLSDLTPNIIYLIGVPSFAYNAYNITINRFDCHFNFHASCYRTKSRPKPNRQDLRNEINVSYGFICPSYARGNQISYHCFIFF